MQDALIITATAIIGALLMDLQRRLPLAQRAAAGLLFLAIGMIILFLGSASANVSGVALGAAFFLVGVILLLPAITRMLWTGHRSR